MALTQDQVRSWLEEVKDPEIPVLSLVDLGVITAIDIAGDRVRVEMTPTFVGCPALELMKEEVLQVLRKYGVENPEVAVSFRDGWSSDKISERGKQALKKFGLSPPPDNRLFTDLEIMERAQCPRCEGTDTELKNPFGPTLCRAIYYCNHCREAFEQFKPL
ncbi:MAG: 1,2-phenylacetyl-CoA epoxidase subunit PaaD [Bacteroidota bacterium]